MLSLNDIVSSTRPSGLTPSFFLSTLPLPSGAGRAFGDVRMSLRHLGVGRPRNGNVSRWSEGRLLGERRS